MASKQTIGSARSSWRARYALCGDSRDDRGVVGLEMAILFPAVLIVILSMFQISLYWHTANSVGVAAEQGLNAGRLHPDDPDTAIARAEAEARWILANTNRGDGEPVVTVNGDLLVVTVTANAPRIVGPGTWQVRSVAEGRFEEFVPAGER